MKKWGLEDFIVFASFLANSVLHLFCSPRCISTVFPCVHLPVYNLATGICRPCGDQYCRQKPYVFKFLKNLFISFAVLTGWITFVPQDRRRKNTEIINCLYSWGSFISPSNMECLSAFLINDCMYLHRFYINTKISFICGKLVYIII